MIFCCLLHLFPFGLRKNQTFLFAKMNSRTISTGFHLIQIYFNFTSSQTITSSIINSIIIVLLLLFCQILSEYRNIYKLYEAQKNNKTMSLILWCFSSSPTFDPSSPLSLQTWGLTWPLHSLNIQSILPL